jgi:hypothetical protein
MKARHTWEHCPTANVNMPPYLVIEFILLADVQLHIHFGYIECLISSIN